MGFKIGGETGLVALLVCHRVVGSGGLSCISKGGGPVVKDHNPRPLEVFKVSHRN